MGKAVIKSPHHIVGFHPVEAVLKIDVKGVAVFVQYLAIQPDMIVVNLQGKVG